MNAKLDTLRALISARRYRAAMKVADSICDAWEKQTDIPSAWLRTIGEISNGLSALASGQVPHSECTTQHRMDWCCDIEDIQKQINS